MNAIVAALVLASTLYTLAQDVYWMPVTGKGDVLFRYRFPDGFVYP
jgi:hypothetical protein